jgi:hypothetical protein
VRTVGADGMEQGWEVARETRSAAEITALVQCRVPWRFNVEGSAFRRCRTLRLVRRGLRHGENTDVRPSKGQVLYERSCPVNNQEAPRLAFSVNGEILVVSLNFRADGQTDGLGLKGSYLNLVGGCDVKTTVRRSAMLD